MTQFNPENKSELTYGEVLGPAMGITDAADAAIEACSAALFQQADVSPQRELLVAFVEYCNKSLSVDDMFSTDWVDDFLNATNNQP